MPKKYRKLLKVVVNSRIHRNPEKKDSVESMVGLGKDVWDELGGAEKYLQNERNSWQR